MTQQRTYDSGGQGTTTIREELGDEIYILSPMDTPLLSLFDHEVVRQRNYDWLLDDIQNPTGRTAQLEGFTVGDSSNLAAANRTRQRVDNFTHIDALAIHVSHSQRLANEAGVEDEYSYQVAQKGLELLKQVDYNIHWSEYTAGAAGIAQMTAGLYEWLITAGLYMSPNADAGASSVGDYLVAGNTIPRSRFKSTFWANSATTAMTETQFQQVAQVAWGLGMDINASIVFCGGPVKRHISDFGNVYGTAGTTLEVASAHRRNIDAADRRKIMPIDFYYTDFGELAIALDRRLDTNVDVSFDALTTGAGTGAATGVSGDELSELSALTDGGIRPSNTLFAVDPAFHSVAVYQPFYYEEIARRGNSTEGYVVMEHGYKPRSPIAMFGVANVLAITAGGA